MPFIACSERLRSMQSAGPVVTFCGVITAFAERYAQRSASP